MLSSSAFVVGQPVTLAHVGFDWGAGLVIFEGSLTSRDFLPSLQPIGVEVSFPFSEGSFATLWSAFFSKG